MIKDITKLTRASAVAFMLLSSSSIVSAQDITQQQATAFSFSATRAPGGFIALSGQVPSEASITFLNKLTGARPDRLAVSAAAPADFVETMQAGMRALMELQQGRLALENGTWTLTGEATSGEQIERLTASLPAAITAEFSILESAPLAAAPAPVVIAQPAATRPAPTLDAARLAACQSRLAELSAHNAILFRSGSAVIADSAASELDLFAETLKGCGSVAIDVEGHTDSDGQARQNLVLSVSRAEAVVRALVDRGVDSGRLYAVGYGQSQPIAANDTQAGKAANRRIVVKLRAD